MKFNPVPFASKSWTPECLHVKMSRLQVGCTTTLTEQTNLEYSQCACKEQSRCPYSMQATQASQAALAWELSSPPRPHALDSVRRMGHMGQWCSPRAADRCASTKTRMAPSWGVDGLQGGLVPDDTKGTGLRRASLGSEEGTGLLGGKHEHSDSMRFVLTDNYGSLAEHPQLLACPGDCFPAPDQPSAHNIMQKNMFCAQNVGPPPPRQC